MDWAAATFFDRVIYGLWLDPEWVRGEYDIDAIGNRQHPQTQALVEEWRKVAPGADAAVVEFTFRASGNAKRKLLRRLESQGSISKWRGGLSCRSAMSFKWLDDYALAYDIVAVECGGELIAWRIVAAPLQD